MSRSVFLIYAMLCALVSNAQLVQLQLDTVAVHTGLTSDGVDLTGMITYRLYAVCEDSNDVVVGYGANLYDYIRIKSSEPLFQSAAGGYLADEIPCSIDPASSVAFDSWLTIDCDNECSCADELHLLNQVPNIDEFEEGGELFVFGNPTFTDGAWPMMTFFDLRRYALAGADHRVLLAQFTTAGDLHFHAAIEIMPLGDNNYSIDGFGYPILANGYSMNFPASICNYGYCLAGSSNPFCCNYVPGAVEFRPCSSPHCNDPQACNYNPTVTCPGDCFYNQANDACSGAAPVNFGDTIWLIPCNGTINTTGSVCTGGITRDWWYTFQYEGGAIEFVPFDTTHIGLSAVLSIYSSCNGAYLWCNSTYTGDTLVMSDNVLTVGNTYLLRIANATLERIILHYNLNGCTDANACNYDPIAQINDGSCVFGIFGCMDTNKCNFNPLATCEGLCLGNRGCMDETAFNYSPQALCSGTTCMYCNENANCINAIPAIIGQSFNPNAVCHDTTTANPSCSNYVTLNSSWYTILYTGGRINISHSHPAWIIADLYDSCGSEELLCSTFNNIHPVEWDCDDGLVIGNTYYLRFHIFNNSSTLLALIEMTDEGCMDPAACNYDGCALYDDSSCQYVSGCTDAAACNYNSLAYCDDGSCTTYGCTDEVACNYSDIAGCDDGSCRYADPNDDCSNPTPIVFDEIHMANSACAIPVVENMPLCENYNFDPSDLWFTFNYETGGDILIILHGTSAHYSVAVRDSCNGDELFCTQSYTSETWQNTIIGTLNEETGLIVGHTYLLQVVLQSTSWPALGVLYFSLRHSIIPGCTDELACNYSAEATLLDGTCLYGLSGCMDAEAYNFNSQAVCDDGTCISYCGMIDFDNSGTVGMEDLSALLSSFGCYNNCGAYDLNDDSVVGVGEILIFIANFDQCGD